MSCAMCLSGYHISCLGCECTHQETPIVQETNEETTTTDPDDDNSRVSRDVDSRITSGRSNKRDALLKDQQSTGRKRAAKMYPLNPEAPCEWQGLANVGGGKFPIVGCLQGKQEARHHGPDKNVTNNEEGNVHRICHTDHYRWHAANDGTYDWNETVVQPHAPRPMTNEDRDASLDAFLKYKANKSKRIKD